MTRQIEVSYTDEWKEWEFTSPRSNRSKYKRFKYEWYLNHDLMFTSADRYVHADPPNQSYVTITYGAYVKEYLEKHKEQYYKGKDV